MYSLRGQIRGAILVGVGLLWMILATQLLLSIRGYGEKVDAQHEARLREYAAQLEDGMEQLSGTVGEIYAVNNTFGQLGEGGQSVAEQWDDAYELKGMLQQQGRANKYLSGLFLFYDNYERDLYYVKEDVPHGDLQLIRETMRAVNRGTAGSPSDYVKSPAYLDAVLRTDGAAWYYVLIQKKSAAIAGFLDLSLGLPRQVKEEESGSFGVLCDGKYYCVRGGEDYLSEETRRSLSTGKNRVRGSVIYYQEIPSQDIAVVELVPESLGLYIDGVRLLASALLFLLLPFGILLYRFVMRQILRPLDDMTVAMRQIREGDWEVQFRAPNRMAEIENVRQAIRVMVAQIENYKIRVYEEELARQQTELSYLRLQLTPHFYTNCLKNAYYMLQLGEYENAGRFLLCLSRHLRYLLGRDEAGTTVRQEAEFVRNYIEMERYLVSEPLECEIELEEAVQEARIPLLAIQTFVENSVKYARKKAGGMLRIAVRAAAVQRRGKTYLQITVRDNGAGYAAAQLERINGVEAEQRAERSGNGGAQTAGGIANLLSRLQIFFDGAAQWRFQNDGGVKSEITMPLRRMAQ